MSAVEAPAQLHDSVKMQGTGEAEIVGHVVRAAAADARISFDSTRKNGTKSSPYRGVTLFRPTMKWRAQISADGKTTSLGDHDTEADAARAFDRAAINKHGTEAKTNFPIADYKDEVEDLQAMTQVEMVAMLRSKARKSGTQTSHYRGVSLLKQTKKWHAQINVCGKQVHLGFFPTEEEAARAYDRSAINKGARDGGKIVTNMDIEDYARELDKLRRIHEAALVDALATEQRRKAAVNLLLCGTLEDGVRLFGSAFDASPNPSKCCSVAEMRAKAERSQPKPTEANPLYANFGRKREAGEGGERQPIVTRPPNFPPPSVQSASRPQGRLRALFAGRKGEAGLSEESSEESDAETIPDFDAMEQADGFQPARRSARNRGRIQRQYTDGSDSEATQDEHTPQPDLLPPQRLPAENAWTNTSPPFRGKRAQRSKKHDDSSDEEKSRRRKDGKRRRAAGPAKIEPAADPSPDLLAYALAAAKGQTFILPDSAGPANHAQEPAFSEMEAVQPALRLGTVESEAKDDTMEPVLPRTPAADKCSKAFPEGASPEDKLSILSADANNPPRQGSGSSPKTEPSTPSVDAGHQQKLLPLLSSINGRLVGLHPLDRLSIDNTETLATLRGGSVGAKGSNATAVNQEKASSVIAGLGVYGGDKHSDAGFAKPLALEHGGSIKAASSVNPPAEIEADLSPLPELPTPPTGKRTATRRGFRRIDGEATPLSRRHGRLRPPSLRLNFSDDSNGGKPTIVKGLTKRQRAMLQRQEQKRKAQAARKAMSETSLISSFAANAAASPQTSALDQGLTPGTSHTMERGHLEDDAASQSSPRARVGSRVLDNHTVSSNEGSHAFHLSGNRKDLTPSMDRGESAVQKDSAHRRKNKKPIRGAI